MSIINLKEKTINAKIVYYGTALGGKTTSLKHVHRVIDPDQKIELVSLNTDKDRTLFFDFLPISVGRIGDFTVRLQGFTVPGQVKYNLTRKYVLTGADAVVLVIDSRRSQLESNLVAMNNLRENLAANGLDYSSIPLVLQYNKRDLDDLVTADELGRRLNDRGIPAYETVATEGTGVFEAFIDISKQMMDHIAGQYRITADRKSVGEILERNLTRLLKGHQGDASVTASLAEPREERPRSVVQLAENAQDDNLAMPEELLRKAVDSNIEIAQLYSEVNEVKNRLRDRVRELTVLHEVGKTVTSQLDVDRLLQTIVDQATSCLGTEFGSLMLLNRNGDDLLEKVVTGFLRDPLAGAVGCAEGQPVLFSLAVRGEALLLTEDESSDLLRAVKAQDERIRSLMVAPLVLKETVVGVIVVYFMEGGGEGTPDKLNFLSALAGQAAIALENARLVARIEGFNRELEQTVKERTAELREAYEELKELDRMKDDFLSSMSHELLTPLTSIQSFSEILLGMSDAEALESSGEFVGIIHGESLRLTHRLKDLLDLSQIESGQVKFSSSSFQLRSVLDELFRTMGPDFRSKSLRAIVRSSGPVSPVWADRNWVMRALASLLSNAVKFSDEGGEVEITLAGVDEEVRLTVTDHGCGIADEFKEAVFERFKQIGDLLTDKPAGIGLGLPLARLIIEGQGGRIWLESAPGNGASFSFSLPVFTETADLDGASEPTDIREKLKPLEMWRGVR